MMELFIAGEDIPAGSSVTCSAIDGKAYVHAAGLAGTSIGVASENLREGFRIAASEDGTVREDDA